VVYGFLFSQTGRDGYDPCLCFLPFFSLLSRVFLSPGAAPFAKPPREKKTMPDYARTVLMEKHPQPRMAVCEYSKLIVSYYFVFSVSFSEINIVSCLFRHFA